MKIDIWSDIACPFCYIGLTQLNQALNAFAHKKDVSLTHRSFQLDPAAPESTTQSQLEALAAKKDLPPEQVKAMFEQVQASAKASGLTINFDTVVPVNTLRGHRLIHFAASHGKANQAVMRLFEAYFAQGKNVADRDTLVAIASDLALDTKAAEAALDSDDHQTAIQTDLQLAASYGINGVPFFLINETYALSGAQGQATFAQALQQIWHETNPITQLGSDSAQACVDGFCLPAQKD